MYVRTQLFLFRFMAWIGRKECSKLWKRSFFEIFLSVLVFFPEILGRLMSDLY